MSCPCRSKGRARWRETLMAQRFPWFYGVNAGNPTGRCFDQGQRINQNTATWDTTTVQSRHFEKIASTYRCLFRRGGERMVIGKLKAQWTRGFSNMFNVTLWGGPATAFDRTSKVMVTVPGIGSLTETEKKLLGGIWRAGSRQRPAHHRHIRQRHERRCGPRRRSAGKRSGQISFLTRWLSAHVQRAFDFVACVRAF